MAATEPADFHQPQVQNIYGCFFLQPDVLKTWRFVNLTFCKPDVLLSWRFVNLTFQTFWNRTFCNLTFWNLTFCGFTLQNSVVIASSYGLCVYILQYAALLFAVVAISYGCLLLFDVGQCVLSQESVGTVSVHVINVQDGVQLVAAGVEHDPQQPGSESIWLQGAHDIQCFQQRQQSLRLPQPEDRDCGKHQHSGQAFLKTNITYGDNLVAFISLCTLTRCQPLDHYAQIAEHFVIWHKSAPLEKLWQQC